MEFRLLGPIEVSDGEVLALGGRQRRTLLAILLVHAGEPVSTDRLVEELWGVDAPPTARKTVQAHVAHLRRVLNRNGDVLEAAGDGYVAHVNRAATDVGTFERLVQEGRHLKADDPLSAAAVLEEALALFRGAPLTGVADDAFSLRVEADRLAEARLSVTEDLLELQLAGGDWAAAVDRAERLVAEHPLREGAWGLLMLGLYRSGRQSEALRAFGRVRQILAEELGIEPSSDLRDLEQKILDQDPSLDDAGFSTRSPSSPQGRRRNPFKGLRPFVEDDAGDFFGRDDLGRRLVEEVTRRDGGGGLVVLAGPSGAGKSSVARAGVVPRLREAGVDVAVMLPGPDPFTAAAKAFPDGRGQGPESVRRQLIEGHLESNVVVVVDQAEELFTMMNRSSDTSDFLDVVAAASPEGIRWLLTVRADFIEHLMLHPGIGARLEQSLVLTPSLQEHEVAAAVAGPAARVGVDVSPDLIREITRDVAARPATLPLMQYALTDSFERLRGPTLTLDDYRQAGGISGTLSRRADSIVEVLDEQGGEAARRILLRLVTITDEGERVRRRVPRRVLEGLPVAGRVLDELIERFGTQRLLTFDQDPDTAAPTVEIAHESLLTEWSRLRAWIDDARDDLLTERRLGAAMDEWEDSGREPSFLLGGARLAEMESWAEESRVDLAEAERHFLGTSRDAEDFEGRRRRRRRRALTGVMGVAAAAVAVSAVIAFIGQQDARASERIAVTRELVAASAANLAVDLELATLLALEAVDRSGDDVPREAEEALHEAVVSSRLIASLPHRGEGIAHVSPDGETFVASAGDPTTVVVRRIDTLEEVVTLEGHDDLVVDAVYDAPGERIVTTSTDGTVRIWDVATGTTQSVLRVSGSSPPLIPVFSRDGSLVAASTFGGPIWVWDVATGEVVWELGPRPGTRASGNLEFSPDDTLLATAAVGGEEVFGADIWDVDTGEWVTTVAGHDSDVKDVGFTPDGRLLVTAAWDAYVKIWEVGTWENVGTYVGHETTIWDLQISADGTRVASSADDGEVLVWDLATLETLFSLVGHRGVVDGIDLTPDGDVLVTAGVQDGTTRLWDLTSFAHNELFGLPKPDESLAAFAFTADNGLLTAGPEAGELTLWSLPDGDQVARYDGPDFDIYQISHFPEADMIGVAGSAGVELLTAEGDHLGTLAAGEPAELVAIGPSSTVAAGLLGDSQGVYTWADPFGEPDHQWSDLEPRSLAFHPHEPLLAMALWEINTYGTVEVWDLDSRELVVTLPSQSQFPVNYLAFTPDGEELVTSDANGQSIVWDTQEYRPMVRSRSGQRGEIWQGALDPVRREYATVGVDATLRILSLDTGEELLALPTMVGSGRVGYSPDGRYVVVGNGFGYMVYVRDVHELADVARSRLTRELTAAECLQFLHLEECPEKRDDLPG